MINFSLKNILSFCEQIDAAQGIRDVRLIESAVNTPFQTFDGRYLYSTITDKAARLGFGLTKNHGFIDGNKRVALHAMELFLRLNGIFLTCTQPDRIDIMKKLAAGYCTEEQLKIWIRSNSQITPSIIRSGTITIFPK